MSLSAWPGANITSSPGFQLAGAALATGASLVHPARIPGYRFFRPLKAKIVAGVAIVAVLGVILLSPPADTNISAHDVALEDSAAWTNQRSLNWDVEDNGPGADYNYIAKDLLDQATVEHANLFDRLATVPRLGLDALCSIVHTTMSDPLKNLDAHFHDVSGFADNGNDWSRSYLEDLDTLYHTLDDKGVFNWSTYEIVSMLLFISLCFRIVKRLYTFSFGCRAPALVTPKSEISLISNFVFADAAARIERYVPQLDATLQLFATVTLERDGRPHSTGYIFDMYNDGSHTGRLFVQQPALPDTVDPMGLWSLVPFLRRCFRAVVSFVAMIHYLVVSPFAWCRGKSTTEKKVRWSISADPGTYAYEFLGPRRDIPKDTQTIVLRGRQYVERRFITQAFRFFG